VAGERGLELRRARGASSRPYRDEMNGLAANRATLGRKTGPAEDRQGHELHPGAAHQDRAKEFSAILNSITALW
jgi:hypothetical protein